jgi:membrane-associated phospholipid phosphatase
VTAEPSSGNDKPEAEAKADVASAKPATPAVTRRPVAAACGALLALWAVLCGLLLLVGEAVTRSSVVRSLDRRITAVVVAHRTPALNQLMEVVTWAGSWVALLVVGVIVLVLAWRGRLSAVAVAALLAAWLGQLVAVTLTKAVVQRPRPPDAVRLVAAHGWSFPSGHSANAVVMFAAVAALLGHIVRSRTGRALIWALAVLATALVGFSRIELGVHWMTDVAASLIWTSGWAVIVVKVVLCRSEPEH